MSFDWSLDWLSWIYGKWFVGHPWRGFFTLLIPMWLVLSLVLGVLWLKAIDAYKDKQATPKQQTATVINNSVSASQNVTVNGPAQGMPVSDATQSTATKPKRHVAKTPTPTRQAPLREAVPKQEDANPRPVPTVPFSARCLSMEIIVENGVTHGGCPSGTVSINDTVRGDGSTMIDVQHATDTVFDNDTLVGKGSLLKAEQAEGTKVSNSISYADPADYWKEREQAHPASPSTGTNSDFNYADWIGFLEDYFESPKAETPKLIERVRQRLETQWKQISENERRENEANFAQVLRDLANGGWDKNVYYRNNVPTFVRLPKQ